MIENGKCESHDSSQDYFLILWILPIVFFSAQVFYLSILKHGCSAASVLA
jgi:hypothetical protein